MAEQSSDPGQSVSSPAGATPSSLEVFRWITLLPGLFLVSSSFVILAGTVLACMLPRPVPIVMELVIPVIAGWTGVVFAYHWAPDHKWPAARATALLLGAGFWLTSLGWIGPWQQWLSSTVVGLAIATPPWFSQRAIVGLQNRRGRACDQEQECAFRPSAQATPRPRPADEFRTLPAPGSEWHALRWAVVLPAAVVVYFGALTVALAPMAFESVGDERMWLSITFSHVIAGWVALLCAAWISPTRKRSVAYVGYLVFLVLSLPLLGRMLVARGVDTIGAMLGLWLVVALGVAPVIPAVQRLWHGPARARPTADRR